MFYRQKILLAMTEVSGRSVKSTDLQKLLFLFCQTTQQNHYDFFPYQYGAFSFVSYYDKRKLAEQGYLKNKDHFELDTHTSYLNQLKPKDRAAMRVFAVRTKNLRGQNLVRKTYLEYPAYTSRSKIIERTLNQQERKLIQESWNDDFTPTLFTIGYEGSTIDDYLRRLIFNNVKALIDVRRNPLSRKHGFSKKSMQNYLERVGIHYYHMSELGIASHLRKNLNGKSAYDNLFDLYATTVLPLQYQSLNNIKKLNLKHGRIALTCFEADPCMCHRHKITESLEIDPEFSLSIVHI